MEATTAEGVLVPRAFVCLSRGESADRAAAALASLEVDTGFVDRLQDVVDQCEGGDTPTLLLFDVATTTWLGDLAKIAERCPSLRPVLVADLPGPDEFLAALSAGVAGFVDGAGSTEAMARTIRSVIDSGVAIPRAMVGPLVSEVRRGAGHVIKTAAGDVRVTEREWEIVQLLMQRRSTREMAETLYVSVGTVRSHISSVLHKLGAVDRDDAIQLIERGQS